jgi:hypothetical protein
MSGATMPQYAAMNLAEESLIAQINSQFKLWDSKNEKFYKKTKF